MDADLASKKFYESESYARKGVEHYKYIRLINRLETCVRLKEKHWSGNPCVEVIEGAIYYFDRCLTGEILYVLQSLTDRSERLTVCLLVSFIPNHLSPAELHEFFKSRFAHKTPVELIKVLHSSSPKSYHCLIYCKVPNISEFYQHFSQRHYNPIEESVCELYLVDGVKQKHEHKSTEKRGLGQPGVFRYLRKNNWNFLSMKENCSPSRNGKQTNFLSSRQENSSEFEAMKNRSSRTSSVSHKLQLIRNIEMSEDNALWKTGSFEKLCESEVAYEDNLLLSYFEDLTEPKYSENSESNHQDNTVTETRSEIVYLEKSITIRKLKSDPGIKFTANTPLYSDNDFFHNISKQALGKFGPRTEIMRESQNLGHWVLANHSSTYFRALKSPYVMLGKYGNPVFCAVCLEKLQLCSNENVLFGRRLISYLKYLISNATERKHNSSKFLAEIRSFHYQFNVSEIDVPINILCGHTFHSKCLLQWCDRTCPCCRFQQFSQTGSLCETCGNPNNIFMCLICGYLGCSFNDMSEDSFAQNVLTWSRAPGGAYPQRTRGGNSDRHPISAHSFQGHCYDHFLLFNHVYAIEIKKQQVWDFSRNCYIARLIQNLLDGKLLYNEDSPRSEFPLEKKLLEKNESFSLFNEELSSADYEEEFQKIESLFYGLLQSQLESQAEFYELKKKEIRTGFRNREAALTALVENLEHLFLQEEHQFSTAQHELEKCRNTTEALRDEYESLEKRSEEMERLRQRMLAEVSNISRSDKENESRKAKELEDKKSQIKGLKSHIADIKYHLSVHRKYVETGKITPSSVILAEKVSNVRNRRQFH